MSLSHLQRALVKVLTPPPVFCSRVSPGTGDPVLLGRGVVGARPVLDGS